MNHCMIRLFFLKTTYSIHTCNHSSMFSLSPFWMGLHFEWKKFLLYSQYDMAYFFGSENFAWLCLWREEKEMSTKRIKYYFKLLLQFLYRKTFSKRTILLQKSRCHQMKYCMWVTQCNFYCFWYDHLDPGLFFDSPWNGAFTVILHNCFIWTE